MNLLPIDYVCSYAASSCIRMRATLISRNRNELKFKLNYDKITQAEKQIIRMNNLFKEVKVMSIFSDIPLR